MTFQPRDREATKRAMIDALIRSKGNIRKAAYEINMPRRTFYRWLEREGLNPAVNELRRRRMAKDPVNSLDELIGQL